MILLTLRFGRKYRRLLCAISSWTDWTWKYPGVNSVNVRRRTWNKNARAIILRNAQGDHFQLLDGYQRCNSALKVPSVFGRPIPYSSNAPRSRALYFTYHLHVFLRLHNAHESRFGRLILVKLEPSNMDVRTFLHIFIADTRGNWEQRGHWCRP